MGLYTNIQNAYIFKGNNTDHLNSSQLKNPNGKSHKYQFVSSMGLRWNVSIRFDTQRQSHPIYVKKRSRIYTYSGNYHTQTHDTIT